MDSEEDEFFKNTFVRVRYLQTLMAYIASEWDNVPEEVSVPHAIFLNQCYDQGLCIPNAAGNFAELYLIKDAVE